MRLLSKRRMCVNLMGTGFVGSDIQGGDSQHIAAGDLLIIPAGVPHGFRSIDSDAVQLEVVRIDGGRTLALK
jgi:quercetin dioxygenase-like cupin family protein